MGFRGLLLKTLKGWVFLHFQVQKLALPGFMNTRKRHAVSGLETNLLVSVQQVAQASYLHWGSVSLPHQGPWKWHRWVQVNVNT
jgi:hypothetical protein